MIGTRVRQVLDAACHDLEQTIGDFMPLGSYRDFCLWVLRAPTFQRDIWLQAIGAVQIAQLTVALFDGLPDSDAAWTWLAEGAASLSTFLVHEAASDDLAIQLAVRRPDDVGYSDRYWLIHTFNELMVTFLLGSDDLGLDSLRQASDRISLFDQKLFPDKHRALVAEFLQTQGATSAEDLEHAVWPSLVTHMRSAGRIVERLQASPAAQPLLNGLISRYDGVNNVLEGCAEGLSDRVRFGAGTILVMPTLAHYVGVLSEISPSGAGLADLVNDGSLQQALYDAALLSRLLNDLGYLVIQPASERHGVLTGLAAQAGAEEISLAELILATRGQLGGAVTRLEKDVVHGEFNTCLDGLWDMPARSGLEILEQRIEECADMYSVCQARLLDSLSTFENSSSKHGIGQIISRFVKFHEVLYANPYTAIAGDYTV